MGKKPKKISPSESAVLYYEAKYRLTTNETQTIRSIAHEFGVDVLKITDVEDQYTGVEFVRRAEQRRQQLSRERSIRRAGSGW